MFKTIFESRYRDKKSQLLYSPLKKTLSRHETSPQKKMELQNARLTSTLCDKFKMLDETAANTIIKEAHLPEEVLLDESTDSPERIRKRGYTIIDVSEQQQDPINQEEFKLKMKNLFKREIVYKYATSTQKDWGNNLEESQYVRSSIGEVYPTGPNRNGRLTNEQICKIPPKLNSTITSTNQYRFEYFAQKRASHSKPISRNFYSCMDNVVNDLTDNTKCSLLASRVQPKWQ